MSSIYSSSRCWKSLLPSLLLNLTPLMQFRLKRTKSSLCSKLNLRFTRILSSDSSRCQCGYKKVNWFHPTRLVAFEIDLQAVLWFCSIGIFLQTITSFFLLGGLIHPSSISYLNAALLPDGFSPRPYYLRLSAQDHYFWNIVHLTPSSQTQPATAINLKNLCITNASMNRQRPIPV